MIVIDEATLEEVYYEEVPVTVTKETDPKKEKEPENKEEKPNDPN